MPGTGTRTPACLAAAAALACLLALPGAAQAAPSPGAYGGRTAQAEVATARVSSDGMALRRFNIHWFTPTCTVGQPFSEATTHIAGFIPLRADGGFGPISGSYTAPGSQPGNTQFFHWDLRGTVTSRKLSGIFHITLVEKTSGGTVITNCDSGQVNVKLPHSRVYTGGSSQGVLGLVSLRRSKLHRRISGFRINWQATCQPPPGLLHTTQLNRIRVRRGTGRFRKSKSLSWTTHHGNKVTGKARLRGKLGRRKARGAFRFAGQVFAPNGNKLADCSTGRIRWSARR
ncbi:MAG: hypothetical protein ABR581_00390 [Thermoleophilaceae bacterium]